MERHETDSSNKKPGQGVPEPCQNIRKSFITEYSSHIKIINTIQRGNQRNTDNVTADNSYSVPRTIIRVVGGIISNIKRSPGFHLINGKILKEL